MNVGDKVIVKPFAQLKTEFEKSNLFKIKDDKISYVRKDGKNVAFTDETRKPLYHKEAIVKKKQFLQEGDKFQYLSLEFEDGYKNKFVWYSWMVETIDNQLRLGF